MTNRQPCIIAATLCCLLAVVTSASAHHERFIVGEMRDVNPSPKIITSISGTCVPSHDRERLDCYFTAFLLSKRKTEDQVKKDYEEAVNEMNKDPQKVLKELRKSTCEQKFQPDPVRLKYNVAYEKAVASTKAFCEHPTRESALNLFRTMNENDAGTCNCVVNDWRATFVRQTDRWVANIGPSGLCGVISVFTLVPHDVRKMRQPTGPTLWTLTEKTVTTHRSNDPLCANPEKNPLLPTITEGASTFSWNAPPTSIDCREFEFTSALEGMSDPRGLKGK